MMGSNKNTTDCVMNKGVTGGETRICLRLTVASECTDRPQRQIAQQTRYRSRQLNETPVTTKWKMNASWERSQGWVNKKYHFLFLCSTKTPRSDICRHSFLKTIGKIITKSQWAIWLYCILKHEHKLCMIVILETFLQIWLYRNHKGCYISFAQMHCCQHVISFLEHFSKLLKTEKATY